MGSSTSTHTASTLPQPPAARTQQSHNRPQRGNQISQQSRLTPYDRPRTPSDIGQILTICKTMDTRLKRLETQTSDINSSLQSVTALLEKHLRASFQIKGSIYEVYLFVHYLIQKFQELK